MILETLKNVDAVGKDIKIRSSIFGGCGKDGQTVRVGHGGPYVRIGKVAVGGGAW
jgi:TldD protein